MSAIARVYWRCIKRGTRSYSGLSEKLKGEVMELARADVAAGVITEEQLAELTAA